MILTSYPETPFKVTLVWTDPPVSTFSSHVLVNDLDLSIHYDNNTFYPNNLSTFDRYNNVEMINIPGNTIRTEAETVNITVNVKVHRLETKSQDFSIVMTGEFDSEIQPIVIRDSSVTSHVSFFLLIAICLAVQFIL